MSQIAECQLRLDDAQLRLYALDVLWILATTGLALALPRRVRPVILVSCLIVGTVVLHVTWAINGSNRL